MAEKTLCFEKDFFLSGIKNPQCVVMCLNNFSQRAGQMFTFHIHEVTEGQYCNHKGYVPIISQHPYVTVVPVKHSLRGLCNRSPGIPHNGLKKGR